MTGPIDKSNNSIDSISSEETSSASEPRTMKVQKAHSDKKRAASDDGSMSETSLPDHSVTQREEKILGSIAAKESLLDAFLGAKGSLTPMMEAMKHINNTAFSKIISLLQASGAEQGALDELRGLYLDDKAREFFGKPFNQLNSTDQRFLEKYQGFTRDRIIIESKIICGVIAKDIQVKIRSPVSVGDLENNLSIGMFRNAHDPGLAFAIHIFRLRDSYEAVNQMRPEGDKITWPEVVEAYRKYDTMLTDFTHFDPETLEALVFMPPFQWQDLKRKGLILNFSLAEVPADIGNLQELRVLELVGNYLTFLPQEMQHLTQLKELALNRNRFADFPMTVCQLTHLQWLSLNDNQLTRIPEEIGNLTNLQHLDLSGNQLTTLPVEIGNLRGLKTLILTGNPITWDALPVRLQKSLKILKKNGLVIEGLEEPVGKIHQKVRSLKKRFHKK